MNTDIISMIIYMREPLLYLTLLGFGYGWGYVSALKNSGIIPNS